MCIFIALHTFYFGAHLARALQSKSDYLPILANKTNLTRKKSMKKSCKLTKLELKFKRTRAQCTLVLGAREDKGQLQLPCGLAGAQAREEMQRVVELGRMQQHEAKERLVVHERVH